MTFQNRVCNRVDKSKRVGENKLENIHIRAESSYI